MTRSFLDSDGHADLVARLEVVTDQIQTELDQLEDAVAVLRSQWSGSAQEAYDQAHREWSSTMLRLNALLRQTTINGATARDLLVRADSDAAAIWA